MTQYQSITDPASTTSTHEEKTTNIEAVTDGEVDYEYKRWCGIRRSTVLFVFYVVSYLSYLGLGGYLMACLETSHVMDLKGTWPIFSLHKRIQFQIFFKIVNKQLSFFKRTYTNGSWTWATIQKDQVVSTKEAFLARHPDINRKGFY